MRTQLITLLCLAPFLSPGELLQDGNTADPVFSIYVENDAFSGQDRHYSSGIRLSWISGHLEDDASPVFSLFPFRRGAEWQRHFGFAVGQSIYTPDDIERSDLIRDDRPYAGWTYFSAVLIGKNEEIADSLEFQLGLVGRHSYAQDTQELFHQMFKGARPNGWAHQLEDEPGVNLIYQRRWRLAARAIGEHLGMDFIPHAGASLGNVATYANIGANARLGFNLPGDFGTGAILNGGTLDTPFDSKHGEPFLNRFGFHILAGVDGRLVGRDIFLDGNTWADSHSVDKEYLVADLFYGVGAVFGKWKCTFKLVHRTKEFKKQDHHNRFGGVTLSRTF